MTFWHRANRWATIGFILHVAWVAHRLDAAPPESSVGAMSGQQSSRKGDAQSLEHNSPLSTLNAPEEAAASDKPQPSVRPYAASSQVNPSNGQEIDAESPDKPPKALAKDKEAKDKEAKDKEAKDKEAKDKEGKSKDKDKGSKSKNKAPKTLAEKLENLGRVYKDDKNPIMQELWFLGRYHGQYYTADSEQAQQDEWENRRFRIGSQGKFFDKLTLHAQMVSGTDMLPFYNGFTELWSQWAFDDSFALTVGQQKHRFTHDRNVSSRYITTLERSMLTNMFNLDYTPAVTASGKIEKFSYYTGVFSNATSRDMWDAFSNYDSGYSLLASGTWDVNNYFGMDEAFLNLGYLYSDANENATNLNRYKDGYSAALILTEGPSSLVSEVLLGTRSANGDAMGVNIQPGYFITEKLQLSTRYQLAFSDEPNGLTAQRRYERTVGVNSGDVYQAGYAGFNYYLAGHRVKLMNGLEYANMSGQDLWTASIAVRVFWGPNSNGPYPMAKLLKPDR